MDAIFQTMRSLGGMRLIVIGGTAVATVAFFAFLMTRMSSPDMALLYSGLDPADGGAIVAKLDAQKIPYEANAGGSEIRVPSDQVGKLRMQMAGLGLPRGGSIGYEIFDQKDSFGVTGFVQNLNHLRALEGELARTVGTLGPVSKARVHLVLPRRELFGQGSQEATASVFLQLRNPLAREQVGSIRQLVASAVPGLSPNHVAVVDDRGTLLASVQDGATEGTGDSSNNDDRRATYERGVQRKIEELLASTVGFGKVRAQVSADLDFDRVTTSTESYDPDGQVVRSTQTSSEQGSTSDSAGGATSVSTNLPANAKPADGGAGNANSTNHSEETVNYEISRTTRSHTRESGVVRRLSVSVVVDGVMEKDAAGKETWRARSAQELDQIKALVRSAVNFDQKRGDVLEVANLRFTDSDLGASTAEEKIMGLIPQGEMGRLMHLAEMLAMTLLGFLVFFTVVRPLVRRLLEELPSPAGGSGGGGAMGGAGAPQLADGSGRMQLAPPGGLGQEGEGGEGSALEQMIDISRVEGRVKASSLRKVGEIVDRHPEEAVAILRNWIYQES